MTIRPRTLDLLANQGEIGGGEVMLLSMADAARQAGVDVRVICPVEPSELADRAAAMGFETVALPGAGRLRYALALARWARGTDTLLWCNGLFPSFVTAGRRRVAHLHQLPRSRAQRVFRQVARLGAIATFVPSDFMS